MTYELTYRPPKGSALRKHQQNRTLMQEHEGSKLSVLQKQNTQDSRQDLNGSPQSSPSSNVCDDTEMAFSLDTV